MRIVRSGKREPNFSAMDKGNDANREALESGDLEELIPNGNSSPNPDSSSLLSSSMLIKNSIVQHFLYIIECIVAHIQYYSDAYPTECIMGCIVVGLICLAPTIFRHEKRSMYHDSSIQNDWSATSKYDLKIGRVDHWCLQGDDNSCTCENPLEASPRASERGWGSAHFKNLELIKNAENRVSSFQGSQHYKAEEEAWHGDDFGGYADDFDADPQNGNQSPDVDVVFLGDSITERRMGRRMGKDVERFQEIKEDFDKRWKRENGGKYEALALGIAGDSAPNLLWRLVHGELPMNSIIEPKIYWITIGTNDLHKMECSEEIVLLGILRIVEELRDQKPDAIIVINSILPITYDKAGILVQNQNKGHRGTMDYWSSIVSINRQLELFASKHTNVKYFDANPIFVEDMTGNKGKQIVIDYMDDPLHPRLDGYKAWDMAIQKRLDLIYSKMESKDEIENDPWVDNDNYFSDLREYYDDDDFGILDDNF